MQTSNEYTILMKLLTRPGNPVGAGIEDMLDALGLPEAMGNHILLRKLAGLSQRLRPLGLTIKHNPISRVFYLDNITISDALGEDTTLPDRLAATLLIVITLSYQEGGWVSYDRVKEFRRKGLRGVSDDLRELADMGYVETDTRGKRVRPGTRVGFEIDYETFFRRLASSSDSEE
ncbi:MAG: hypothetical protein RTU92_03535 [Candidatus Thorarchaeota archaeon]